MTEALSAEVKEALAEATLLSYLKPEAPMCLLTDASDTAVGAVQQQHIDNSWQPILSYFSRKLNQRRHAIVFWSRIPCSVYLPIKYFHHFVEGRLFHVFTNHKPLTHSLFHLALIDTSHDKSGICISFLNSPQTSDTSMSNALKRL